MNRFNVGYIRIRSLMHSFKSLDSIFNIIILLNMCMLITMILWLSVVSVALLCGLVSVSDTNQESRVLGKVTKEGWPEHKTMASVTSPHQQASDRSKESTGCLDTRVSHNHSYGHGMGTQIRLYDNSQETITATLTASNKLALYIWKVWKAPVSTYLL